MSHPPSPALRQLIFANVGVLLAAAVTLIWNWAVLTTKIDHIEEDIRSLRSIQNTLVVIAENLSTEVTNLKLLRSDVERLEALHFSPGGSRSREQDPAPLWSPAVRWPPKESHPLDGLPWRP